MMPSQLDYQACRNVSTLQMMMTVPVELTLFQSVLEYCWKRRGDDSNEGGGAARARMEDVVEQVRTLQGPFV